MPFRQRHAFIALLPVVLCAVAGPAQAPPMRYVTEHWIVDRWSTDQGLPQNTVRDMVQTPDGYLWLATFGGLVRFDGVRFSALTTRDYPGLGSDRVSNIALARDGTMWIGTDRGLVRYRDGAFREWTDADGRPASLTNDLTVDSTGAVWLTTQVGGLARFADGKFERFRDRGVPDSWLGAVRIDGDGTVRVDRGDGTMYLRRPGVTDFVRRPASGASASHDTGGVAWQVRNRGIWHRDAAGHATFDAGPEGSGLDNVHTLFVDREGTPWLGTESAGLLRLRRRVFHVYLKRDGLASEQIAGVMRDSRGQLWIGSSCGPTMLMRGGVIRPTSLPGCLFSLAETPDGTVWVGGYGGVTGIRRDGKTMGVPADLLPHYVVFALYAEPDTSIWVGTQNGLVHLGRHTSQRFVAADGLPSNEIHYITRDRHGSLWVGTAGGVARLDGTRFHAWTTRDGLPHNYVRAVYQDSGGMWWIGTYGGGLARFDGHRFVAISTRNGLFDDVVSAIFEDANGNLWMSGNRGVFRAQRRDLDAFADGKATAVISVGYGPSDGLVTAETNGGFQPSAWQDADGRLWFATVRGLATVDPREAMPNPTVPGVAIEAVTVDGKSMPTNGPLDLPTGARSLEIQYTGLTSIAPEQLVFRYRLDGVDRDWEYVNGRRTAYFSHLAPGHYSFVVTAASRDGVWNAEGRRLAFVVPTPWWATIWFRLLVVAAAVALIALLVLRRLAHLHERERLQREFSRHLMAGQETERRRLAAELHDSLSQDLLVMKNRAAMALRTEELGESAREHLTEISHVASQAVQNAREISHGLRPYQLDRLGLAAAIRDLAAHASASAGISIETNVDGAEQMLGPDESIHAYRIVQEALNNIMKHANATHATIGLHAENGRVRLRIADDGRGTVLEGNAGFGLTGIAQRTQLLGGTLDAQSSPGHGMTLDVDLPARAT
jgi:signal transduction histidine kinase/ligand-binding sensor domain-containing protein